MSSVPEKDTPVIGPEIIVTKLIPERSVRSYCFENTIYRDFSNVDVDTIKVLVKCPANKRKGPRGGVFHPFPVRLYEMLSIVDDPDLYNMVSWAPHGRSFQIRQPLEFAKDLMPK
jgi:HSF-type DNA-binding